MKMRDGKYTTLILITSLCVVFQATECQIGLHFQSGQGPRWLELLCDVIDIKSTNFSHLDSLAISRVLPGGSEVLASVSAHYAQSTPVSHVPDAVVAGEISTNDPPKRFIKVTWNAPTANLDGFYKCEAYGVDGNYLPVQEATALRIRVKASGLLLVATPEVINEGLTRKLEVVSTVANLAALGISKVAFLELFRIHNGVHQLIADLKSMPGAVVTAGSSGYAVSGSVNQNQSYVKATWTNPTMDVAGVYTCQGSGVNSSGDPVFFGSNVTVLWNEPERQELVNRLYEMYKEQKESDRLQKDLEQFLRDANMTISRLNKRACAKSCNDIKLERGQHVLTVTPDDGMESITVLCDVDSENQTWTVFQKRFDGSVDFYRNFSEYENGFGDINGEFWLGLKNIRRLIVQTGDENQLRVDMTEMYSHVNYTRSYPIFSISSGPDYMLNVSGFNDYGRGMSYNSGSNFSTYDHGQTVIAVDTFRAAGWWFSDSGYVNLNGVWGVSGKQSSILWYEFRGDLNYVMEKTMMKFSPRL